VTTIERLRGLLAVATPGPWSWDRVTGGIRVRDHYVIASLGMHRFPNADEVLVVGAVNALPALLAVAEAARPILEWWDTTHGNEFDHDHHCRGADPCTCGWAAAEPALNDGLPAALAALDVQEEAIP